MASALTTVNSTRPIEGPLGQAPAGDREIGCRKPNEGCYRSCQPKRPQTKSRHRRPPGRVPKCRQVKSVHCPTNSCAARRRRTSGFILPRKIWFLCRFAPIGSILDVSFAGAIYSELAIPAFRRAFQATAESPYLLADHDCGAPR